MEEVNDMRKVVAGKEKDQRNLMTLIDLIDDKRTLLRNLQLIENSSELNMEDYLQEKKSIFNTLSKVNHLIRKTEKGFYK